MSQVTPMELLGRARRAGAASSLVAAVAVAATSTGFAGVIDGARWLGHVILAVAVVAGSGIVLRSLRRGPYLVAAGQIVALLATVTVVGSDQAVLWVIPGPDAWNDLDVAFTAALDQIQDGVPPVPDTPELRLALLVAVGVIALLVDTLVVAGSAPAAAGLALLCVYAVPAALADDLLPWPSLVAATAGFALLLTVDGRRRHLAWGRPAGSTSLAGIPAALSAAGIALVIALLVGTTVTAVGTEGSLAGNNSQDKTAIGLNPFTSLRGQLEDREPVELFRVTGLEQRSYLRALTLSKFNSARGWEAAPFDGTRDAGPQMDLPQGVDPPVVGPQFDITVEPLDYEDVWLPTYGVPLGVTGLNGRWRYDRNALTVFSLERRKADPYVVRAVLPEPDPAVLRGIRDPRENVDRKYLDVSGLDGIVAQIAIDQTEREDNPLDKAIALRNYFTDGTNGFRYALQTGPPTGSDALRDFLLNGKTGYCEQFASAMAIMLRAIGIPSRVAVGFTPGEIDGDSRLITTEDAHAWVEAWFPGQGWLTFDPTPLSDGRSVVPPYTADGAPLTPDAETPVTPPSLTPTPPPPPTTPADTPSSADPEPSEDSGSLGILVAVLVVLAVGAVIAGLLIAPTALRNRARRRRLDAVHAGGADAAGSAWQEILAESADRGAQMPDGDTVRATADRLASVHGLDQPGRAGLTGVVGAVERSWYGGHQEPDAELPRHLREVRASLGRCAPLGRRDRWLPWSVLPGQLTGLQSVLRRSGRQRERPQR